MADSCETLDFLALLDEVTDETVSRLVCETISPYPSLGFEDRDAAALDDMLSICDSTASSSADSMVLSPQSGQGLADDRQGQVQSSKNSGDPVTQTIRCTDRQVQSSENSVDPLTQTIRCIDRQTSIASANSLTTGGGSCGTIELKPSAISQCVTAPDSGKKSLPKKHRWQFSKRQRQELDVAFKNNMYPSKWKMTELSRALEVPEPTLRVWFQNRRWRLRKILGVSGDVHVRGSRTMLPDSKEAVPKNPKVQPAGATSLRQGPSKVSKPQGSPSIVTTTRPILSKAVKRVASKAKADSTKITAKCGKTAPRLVPLAPLVSNSSPPSISKLPSTLPICGETTQGMVNYNFGMSSVVSNYSLHSPFCWPAGTVRLPVYPYPYPFTSWQNYGLPLLPRFSGPVTTTVPLQQFNASQSSRLEGSSAASAPCIQPQFSKLETSHLLSSSYYCRGASSTMNQTTPTCPIQPAMISHEQSVSMNQPGSHGDISATKFQFEAGSTMVSAAQGAGKMDTTHMNSCRIQSKACLPSTNFSSSIASGSASSSVSFCKLPEVNLHGLSAFNTPVSPCKLPEVNIHWQSAFSTPALPYKLPEVSLHGQSAFSTPALPYKLPEVNLHGQSAFDTHALPYKLPEVNIHGQSSYSTSALPCQSPEVNLHGQSAFGTPALTDSNPSSVCPYQLCRASFSAPTFPTWSGLVPSAALPFPLEGLLQKPVVYPTVRSSSPQLSTSRDNMNYPLPASACPGKSFNKVLNSEEFLLQNKTQFGAEKVGLKEMNVISNQSQKDDVSSTCLDRN